VGEKCLIFLQYFCIIAERTSLGENGIYLVEEVSIVSQDLMAL